MSKQQKNKNLNPKFTPSSDLKSWKILGFIFACGFLLYANTLSHDYSLDDDIYTRKNRFIQEGFSALPDVFNKGSLYGFNNVNEQQYRPLTVLNFLIDTAIFGNDPHAEHFINVVLYGLTGVFLYLLLVRMFQVKNYLFPLTVTLVYIFHPVHTEIVASIKSREEILGFLFAILSLDKILQYVDDKNKGNKLLGIAVLLYFISSLCKETGLTYIAVIPFMLFTFRPLSISKIITITSPFLLAAIVNVGIRYSVMDNLAIKEKIIIMNNSLMAAKTTSEMYATNFVMMLKYIWLLIYPVNLTWDYSYNQVPIVGWSNLYAITSVLIHIALVGYCIYKIKDRDVYVFCIVLYFATLILSSNLIVKIGASMAERFLYAPSLGFCMAAVLLLFKAFDVNIVTGIGKNKNTALSVCAFVLILFSLKTFSRNKDWENNFTLFSSGINVSTNSARAHFALASELRVRGESTQDPASRMNYFTKSLKQYEEGIKIFPDSSEWYNIGVVHYAMGNKDKALESYSKTLASNPKHTMSLNNTGVIYFEGKDYIKALECFTKAIQIDSTFADAQSNAGAVHHNLGDYRIAAAYYEKGHQLAPNNLNTLNNMITVYKNLGDVDKVNFYSQKVAALTGK